MTARPSSKISPPSARSSLPLASPTTGSTSTRDSPAPTGPASAPTGPAPASTKPWPPSAPATPLVVPKLDRLARSVPDAQAIGDTLVARGVRLSLGGSVYDPSDPMSKMFFNMLAVFAEFEADLLKMRTR
ncbi:recombinase family protein [Actinomadura geliboluensis]|uniref:recombinase family protein n=1 Tax=Actinomadura geliboluensis TaxID=882440 RepID=UPI00371152B5